MYTYVISAEAINLRVIQNAPNSDDFIYRKDIYIYPYIYNLYIMSEQTNLLSYVISLYGDDIYGQVDFRRKYGTFRQPIRNPTNMYIGYIYSINI